ncbi:hypothetical protein HHK36_023850 [Tetracentron sinense]|uniref:Uncharacterized protein n=1 Tax=Tetracentron sinense TaxID=13715 RepID=A0A834YM13_TETSI|nr:hypothetical protein HHK36_023850 [Tetracentron sinense]
MGEKESFSSASSWGGFFSSESDCSVVGRSHEGARRNGEEIKADVQKWLTSVDGITSEVEMFFGDDVKFNKRCFSGGCPDWSSRYRLSKEAKKKSLVLIELIREDGKFDSVSFPAPPPGMESIPAGDFMAFESTESAMDEIMEALKDVKINMIGLYIWHGRCWQDYHGRQTS